MRTARVLASCSAIVISLSVAANAGHAQQRPLKAGDTTTVVPGAAYGSPPLSPAIVGDGWRAFWTTPTKVPVLDLSTYAGGLKVDKRGGGMQTITLHMTEKDGWKEYRFRSVDKFAEKRLPNDLEGTFVGRIVQDQTASFFPGAPVLVPPFMAAVGGLHVVPSFYVMADDPRLGEHRSTFSGMLGTLELKGEEAPDDKPGFAGSSKVKDTDKFFEDLYESRAHRVDEREMLAVRLIDMLINDGDRTPDNYDWARFGDKNGYVWRPISRDRDRAFTDARGPLNQYIVRRFYPKFPAFGPTYSMRGLTESAYTFDRRLLQRLSAADFLQVAMRVQGAVTDSVIEAAIAALPAEWRAQTEQVARIRTNLVARRALLPDVAMRLYSQLARETDVILTNDNERAEIMRHPDGRVTVTVADRAPATTVVASAPEVPTAGGATRTMTGEVGAPLYYQRTFVPAETKEIRVYLGKGNDTAVVRGSRNDAITVRIVGDSGNDVLADSVGGGATYLYDAEGKNQFLKKGDTHLSEVPWVEPERTYGFAPGATWRPDWGGSSGWRPIVKHMQGAGLVLGVGPTMKVRGFRRLPYWWQAKAGFLVGTQNGRVAVTADADYRLENSAVGISVAGRASQLEAFRFYGYGNNTPYIGSDLSLVQQRVIALEPALVWNVGWRSRETDGGLGSQDSAAVAGGVRPMVGRMYLGPVVSWTDPEPAFGSPLTSLPPNGGESYSQVSAKLGLELEATDAAAVHRSGWNVRASFTSSPFASGLIGPFGRGTASGATYLPIGNWASLAFRAGGAFASGEFPAQYAATIGGSSTVRGYRSQRFSGDAAANGSTELRVPVGSLNFIVRSQVGVFGLADAGRVWFNGQSDGGWHTGLGGGLWFSSLGRVLSVAYAKGESHRFYLKSGLAF